MRKFAFLTLSYVSYDVILVTVTSNYFHQNLLKMCRNKKITETDNKRFCHSKLIWKNPRKGGILIVSLSLAVDWDGGRTLLRKISANINCTSAQLAPKYIITYLIPKVFSHEVLMVLYYVVQLWHRFLFNYHFITQFILLHEKFLQFDWLRAVVFQLNLKYLHVKITKPLRVVV